MKKTTKLLVKAFGGFVGLVTLLNSCYVVGQDEQAMVTRFGKPKTVIINPNPYESDPKGLEKRLKEEYSNRKDSEGRTKEAVELDVGPGIYFKLPFFDDVKKHDRRILAWDGYPEQIPTADKKYIWIDTTARLYIEDPLKYTETVQGDETKLMARLDDMIDSIVRKHITRHVLLEAVRNNDREMKTNEDVEQIKEDGSAPEKVSYGRDKIMEDIYKDAETACRSFGVRIIDERIKGLDYVASVKENIFKRMTSERKRIADLYRSQGEGRAKDIDGQRQEQLDTILSKAFMTAQGLRGDGDAEATRIYAESYNLDPEFFRFIETMRMYEVAGTPEKMHLVLGTDSPLLRYFKDFKVPEKKK